MGELLSRVFSAPVAAVMLATVPDPGWYTDPTDPERLRYWKGSGWTSLVRPRPAAAFGSALGSTDLADTLALERELDDVEPRPVARTTNHLSTAGFCVGVLALVAAPAVFGPIGIVLAVVGRIRHERLAEAAIFLVVIAMAIGTIIGTVTDLA
jgi:hypothetical protein